MTQHKYLLKTILALLLSGCCASLSAQRVSLKTNALYWATASPNLGVEFRFNRHLTLNMEGAFNRMKMADNKLNTRAVLFTPEMRYWLSARPQAGHFVGLMGLAANYKVRLKDTWHDGDAYGFGATYGYSFVLSRRWSMETTVGLGIARIRERKYADYEADIAPNEPNNTKWVPAPLKAGVTFVYILK